MTLNPDFVGNAEMTGRAIRIVVTVAVMHLCGCATGQDVSERFLDRLNYDAYREARITQMVASAPVGGFIFARKGETICAVKFQNIREQAGKMVNVEGEGQTRSFDLFAEFESYSNVFREGQLVGRWTKDIGKLSTHSIYGDTPTFFGPRRRIDIPCGNFNLYWYYPASLGFQTFYSGAIRLDEQLEFAPTAWRSIDEIDLLSSKLIWYKTLPWKEIKTHVVPISDLAGNRSK